MRAGLSGVSRAIGVFAALAAVACSGAPAPAPAAPEPDPIADEAAESPNDGELKRAVDAIGGGDFAGAKQILVEFTQKNPNNASGQFYYGVALHNLEETDAAIAAYERALKLDPKLGEAWVNLSAVELDVGRPQEALGVVERGLAAQPNNAELLYNRALALQALARSKEAVPAFAKALEASPDNAELKYHYAEALAQSGDPAKARSLLESLVASSDQIEVLASSARLLGGLKAFDACVSALNKALGVRLSSELYVQRGLCKHGLKDEAGTLADFESAVKQDPTFAPAYYYLGMHQKSQGKKAKAKQSLTKAAELAGESGVGKAAKKALSEL
jgi:tetratricopeptide (TPR) repeat protein